MIVFFAATSKHAYQDSLRGCLNWADSQIEQKKARIVKIFKARPEDNHVPIIGEVTEEGFKNSTRARGVNLKLLKRLEKSG